jgi:hypothetical protein
MVTGFFWGVFRSLGISPEVPRPATVAPPKPLPRGVDIERLAQRLARIESQVDRLALARSGSSAGESGVRGDFGGRDYVTHDDLRHAIDESEKRIARNVSDQFGRQMLAIGSLRAMIGETDILLEKVLEMLESAHPLSDRDESVTDAIEDSLDTPIFHLSRSST